MGAHVAHDQRMTVGRGPRHTPRRKGASGPRIVLDQHGAAECLGEMLANDARQRVVGAPAA